MTSLRRGAAFLTLLAAPACSLPARDNPRDSSNAPTVLLRVVEVATGDAVGVASRGQALTLDASSSTDPQGSDLVFEYFLLDTAGNATPFPGVDQPTSAQSIPLDNVFRHSQTPGALIRFRVVARDPGGSVGRGETTLSLTNEPPIAIAPPPRTVALGGHPWTPGVPYQVVFAPEVIDADGADELPFLTYCWTFSPELSTTIDCPAQPSEVCSSDPADPVFTRCIDSDRPVAERGLATLVISDQHLTSLPARTTLTIGPPNLWIGAGVDLGNYEKFDVLRQTYSALASGFSNVSGAFLDGSPRRVVIAEDNFGTVDLQLGTWPAGVPVDVVTLAPGEVEVAGDPSGAAFWTLLKEPAVSATRWTFAGDALLPGTPVPLQLASTFADLPKLTVAQDGSLWVVGYLTAGGMSVSPAGVVTLIEAPVDRVFTGVAARPGTGEVWVVESTNWLGGGIAAPSTLARYDGSGARQPFETEIDQILDLRWASADELWLVTPEQGIVLVDATSLANGALYSESVLVRLPEVFNASFGGIAVDPKTGDLWAEDVLTRVVYRASTNGDLEIFQFVSDRIPSPLFVDLEGALWFHDELDDTLKRGKSPALNGVVEILPIVGGFSAGPDLSSGALWAPSLFPPLLMHVAENGQILKTYQTVTYAGDPATYGFPALFEFRMDPGGEYFIGAPFDFETFTPAGLFLFDLSTEPLSARPLVQKAELQNLAKNGQTVVLEPSAPIPGSTPFLWVAFRAVPTPTSVPTPTPTPPTLFRHISTETGISGPTLLTIPGNEVYESVFSPGDFRYDMRAARALGSNAMCIATVHDDLAANRVVRVRHLLPDGTAQVVGTIPLPEEPVGTPCSNFELRGISAVSDLQTGLDYCWVSVFNQCVPVNSFTTFTAFDSTGSPWRQYVEPGRPFDFVVSGTTRVITLISPPGGGNDDNLRVILDDPTGSSLRREVMPGERGTFISFDSHH